MNVCSTSADALSKLSEQGNKYIKFSDLNIVEVLFLAEFQELIGAAIPKIISLLRPWSSDVYKTGANALVRLSEQGKVSNFLT